MSLLSRIEQDYITAYKAKDALRLSVLRLIKTALTNLSVDKRRDVTEEEAVDVVLKQAKQRQDSIEQYTAAQRPDLADKEAAELVVLKEYLPKALGQEELQALIESTVAELGATSPKDMGRVISAIMAGLS